MTAAKPLTAGELAEYLSVCQETVRTWTRAGKIPCLKISSKLIRYDLASVLRALNREVAEAQP